MFVQKGVPVNCGVFVLGGFCSRGECLECECGGFLIHKRSFRLQIYSYILGLKPKHCSWEANLLPNSHLSKYIYIN